MGSFKNMQDAMGCTTQYDIGILFGQFNMQIKQIFGYPVNPSISFYMSPFLGSFIYLLIYYVFSCVGGGSYISNDV
jgi:hypothetical protein